jgi:4'-phosphopantetheinyl transferase
MPCRNSAPSREASLKDGEVHVWKAPLANDHDPSELTKLLDKEERARAVAFAFDVDRNRYFHSHGVLRLVLARYAGCEASELLFQRGVQQKPHLRQDAGIPDLHFSLSHTDRCALIAVRTSWPVGVDIERLRDLPDVRVLGNRWFTRSENEGLANLSGATLQEAFFDLWTHREAAAGLLLSNCALLDFSRRRPRPSVTLNLSRP